MAEEQLANENEESVKISEASESEETTFTKDQVENMIRAAIDQEVKGLKENNKALKEEKKRVQTKANDFSELITKLGGEEGVNRLVELQNKMDQDEELRLFASGDREKYNDRLLARARHEHSAQMKNLQQERDQWESTAAEAINRYRQREVEKSIIDGCANVGVNPRYYKAMSAQVREDIFYDAETDKVLVRDGDGIRYGKDGQPMGVAEFIDTMREDQPELFNSSTGAGSMGSNQFKGRSVITGSDISRMDMDEYKKFRSQGVIR